MKDVGGLSFKKIRQWTKNSVKDQFYVDKIGSFKNEHKFCS